MSTWVFWIGWCLLLVLSWPLALLALVLAPLAVLLVFVLMLPFRMLGLEVSAVLAFLRAQK